MCPCRGESPSTREAAKKLDSETAYVTIDATPKNALSNARLRSTGLSRM
jgi:hypothetical protein